MTVVTVLLWILAALLALLLLVALALASRVHVEASLAADGRAAVPAAGWARVRWLQLRGRLELPALELRLWFLGIPLRRIRLRGRGAAGPPAEPRGTKEVAKRQDDGEKGSRFRLRRPAIGRLRLALRALRRSVRLERLDAALVIATPDPALTGELLAWGCALRAALPRPAAGRFDLGSDFVAELPRGRLDLGLSVGVGILALAGWRFARAFGLIRMPVGRRRKG